MTFELRSGSGTDLPRVLILTTTFFPDAAVGAIRMTQLARHLPALGWHPLVVCRYYGQAAMRVQLDAAAHPLAETYYLGADALGGHVSESVDQHRGGRAGAALTIARRLGEIATVPDPGIFVWRRARRELASIVAETVPELVLTSGPAHSVHDAGRWLKNYAEIPWIADFRDPYLIDKRFTPAGLTRLLWRRHERFERMIYAQADAVVHCVPTHYRWARRRFPQARERVREIMNGFVGRLQQGGLAGCLNGGRSRVLVAGAIMSDCQTELARAIGHLVRSGHDIELRLVGRRPENVAVLEQLCEGRLVCAGYLPHEDTIDEILSASVLINFRDLFHAESFALGLKLIEYLATRIPIVCINPTRAERTFLRNRAGVECLSDAGTEAIAQAIHNILVLNKKCQVSPRAQGLADWGGVGRRFAQLFYETTAGHR